MKKTSVSEKDILSSVSNAIAALPYPFCIFDENEQALLASETFEIAFRDVLNDPDRPLYEQGLTFTDVTKARLSKKLPEEQVQSRLEAELRKLRTEGTSTRDMMVDGEWVRRIKVGTQGGPTTTLAVPIEELVQRTRSLARAKEEMEHQALHDALTDLPNRRALNAYLEQVLKSDVNDVVVVFHVDLDKFKLVNDTLGHDAGDCVLLEASKILRSEVRSADFVARVGGDEFVMVFNSLPDRDAIEAVATRIVEKMREPIYYDDNCCQIGASIGIAVREEFTTPERIVMDADIALYEAKKAGRGRYSFFYVGHRAKHTAFKKRVFEVREAIMLNAFEPFFQPQICAKTGNVIGFEALARWRDREHGIRLPSEFMAALEEANLLFELDDMILKKSLRRIADWDAEEVDVKMVSINLSAGMLSREDLVDHLKWRCDEAEIAPERIGLEVLENVVVDGKLGVIAKNIQGLKAVGFQVSLDDFGTGNASISSLRHLAPNRIKIAREFISNIDTDEDIATITSALAALAGKLGMSVLCEGVETQAELEFLQKLECDAYQGFLFAKPMESDVVPIWLSDFADERAVQKKRA